MREMARIIPGNERAISRMIGQLYKRGANIIEEKRRLIHVSGHASQEDIRIMTEAVRPRYLVPIHGEYRMLFRHKEFVKNHLNFPEDNIILIENGDVLELDGERAAVVDKREIGRTFIDETGFEEIDSETVRERRQIAYDGVITLILTLNNETGELEAPPDIIARGVIGMDGSNGFLKQAQRVVTEAVEKAPRAERKDVTLLKEHVRVELKRFIQKQNGTKPVILPVIVQV
jgi:ribonuclease J